MQPGTQKQFTLDQNAFADWSAPDGGTVVDGLFTAPNSTGSFRVVATSVLDPRVSATVTVKVADIAVTLSPPLITVARGTVSPNVFTALVVGTANKAVTWTTDPASGSIGAGTPDGNGNARATFTAGTQPGQFLARATTVADATVFDTALVQVLGASSIGINPTSVTLSTTPPNNAVTFTAVLTDSQGNVDSTTALIWDTPTNPVGGTLTGSGLRRRTFTVPISFVGVATCQVRVRTSSGNAVVATVQVVSG